MGIPIGPDTSFLLAETLLGCFDSDLVTRIGNRPGLRFIDEYEFSFGTYTEAEGGIAVLQERLSEFELSLNPRKTGIHECPIPLNPKWLTELKLVALPDSGCAPRRVLLAFIDRAFEIANMNRGEAVMNWAISRLMSLEFSKDQWRIVEQLILQAAVAEPGVLPKCLRLFLITQINGGQIDLDSLKKALSGSLQNAARRGHGSEASWAVWGHILFNLPLDSGDIVVLDQMLDDIVALVTLDAQSRGLIDSSFQFTNWQNLINSDGIRDGHWLLAYESINKGWLVPIGQNPITANPAYNHLAANNVSFYSSDAPSQLSLAHQHSAPNWMTPWQSYLL